MKENPFCLCCSVQIKSLLIRLTPCTPAFKKTLHTFQVDFFLHFRLYTFFPCVWESGAASQRRDPILSLVQVVAKSDSPHCSTFLSNRHHEPARTLFKKFSEKCLKVLCLPGIRSKCSSTHRKVSFRILEAIFMAFGEFFSPIETLAKVK